MLHEFQQQFITDIYAGTQHSAMHINSPVSRLNIYRNNALLGLTQVLENIFPVVQQLVGDTFFKQLAKAYLAINPQSLGYVNAVGSNFANYCKTVKTLSELPYVPEVVALEWAYAAAGTADDANSLTFEDISQFTEKSFLTLHSSAELLTLNYNTLEIWQAHQPDSSFGNSFASSIENLAIKQTENSLLIWRDQQDEVLMLPLDTTLQHFIEQCQQQPFTLALNTALQNTTNTTQLQQQFGQLVASGLFTK